MYSGSFACGGPKRPGIQTQDLRGRFQAILSSGTTASCPVGLYRKITNPLMLPEAVGCAEPVSFPENGSVREIAHQVERLRQARKAADRTDVSFFVNARTDVFLQASQKKHDASLLAGAFERARAYADAGADGLFVPGLSDLGLIAELTKALPLPVNVMVAEGANIGALAKHGVARVSYGADPYVKAMSAFQEAARKAIPR
jgi:2-methylisocitrate lyase-like PEP mutase family enzyme